MAGTIFHGTYRDGIVLNSANTQNPATVAAGGYMTGPSLGILGSSGTAWSLTDLGEIKGKPTATGVYLQSGGTVANGSTTTARGGSTGGLISGRGSGVVLAGAAGTVTNFGTIVSTGLGTIGSRALLVVSGGSVANHGLIESAADAGVSFADKAGTLNNFGVIASTASGALGNSVYLQDGGRVSNDASGRIRASRNDGVSIKGATGNVFNLGTITSVGGRGVYIGAGGTVTNSGAIETKAGTITGTGGTAIQFGAGSDFLVVDPGATFGGVADGGKGRNTLELGHGPGDLTLRGLGTRFVGFGTVEFLAGAAWTLVVAKPADFGETIRGFVHGDTIDLSGIGATRVSLAKGSLAIAKGGVAFRDAG